MTLFCRFLSSTWQRLLQVNPLFTSRLSLTFLSVLCFGLVLRVVYLDFVTIRKSFSTIRSTATRRVIVLMRCKHYEMRRKACFHIMSVSHWASRNVSGTSLPRYYSYYPHFEAARERHIFVPKHFPNENPSSYDHKGLKYFQDVSLAADSQIKRMISSLLLSSVSVTYR